ncbi:MAG TPA: IclR family transcriptional regulator [Solirubrobacterales bacterium]|jgi:DNA-binding IclR family transcriptional regulator
MATKSTPAPRSGQVVPSVLRAGSILDALAAGPPTATLASLSRQLGYPRSSTLALCNSLVEIGLLLRGEDGAYRLGPHTLELSRAFLGQTDLLSEFRRAVAEASTLPEQTLVCAVLRGRDVIYVGNRAGASPLGVAYEVGLRLPAHCTASGLAMLSTVEDEELEALYKGGELERLTPRSVSNLGELRARLAEARQRGYAIDDEETALGMICIGTVVRDDAGGTAGAVAVSMPKGARPAAELDGDAGELRQLAARISRGLGAP